MITQITDLVPYYSTCQNAASVREFLAPAVSVKRAGLVLREVRGCFVPSDQNVIWSWHCCTTLRKEAVCFVLCVWFCASTPYTLHRQHLTHSFLCSSEATSTHRSKWKEHTLFLRITLTASLMPAMQSRGYSFVWRLFLSLGCGTLEVIAVSTGFKRFTA